MIPRPEISHPVECCDEVACFDTGCRPVIPGGLSRVGKVNPRLIDWHSSDVPTRDLGCVPVEEGS